MPHAGVPAGPPRLAQPPVTAVFLKHPRIAYHMAESEEDFVRICKGLLTMLAALKDVLDEENAIALRSGNGNPIRLQLRKPKEVADPITDLKELTGSFSLPHGSGKVLHVLVFAEGAAAREARAQGADLVDHMFE
ncbi:hypothetical protein L2E82_11982 [Cichorium intybus]|uniref:Uncharacterized protein n=1 Tax=Cichorium intybus TaxID=13427 RepID=A0ACB9GET3_CICIN|nr:hypothetical protein L2E82_11982 [Cichorium intybus]